MNTTGEQSEDEFATHRLIRLFVEAVAEKHSQARWHLQHAYRAHLRGILDSREDRDRDWFQACNFMSLKVLEGEIPFSTFGAGSYYLLEGAWFKDVAELKAYYIWKE